MLFIGACLSKVLLFSYPKPFIQEVNLFVQLIAHNFDKAIAETKQIHCFMTYPDDEKFINQKLRFLILSQVIT